MDRTTLPSQREELTSELNSDNESASVADSPILRYLWLAKLGQLDCSSRN